jgi:hypothetical protein
MCLAMGCVTSVSEVLVQRHGHVADDDAEVIGDRLLISVVLTVDDSVKLAPGPGCSMQIVACPKLQKRPALPGVLRLEPHRLVNVELLSGVHADEASC